MIYGPRILNLRLRFMECSVIRYTISNLLNFQFFIPKLYEEEAHIVEILSSRKMDTKLFRKCQDVG